MRHKMFWGIIGVFCIAGGLLVGFGFFSTEPLVILISIDGARADRLRDGNFPHIHALAQEGSRTYGAKTVLPSRTLPAHASMLSGYDVPKHGVTWDEWIGTYLAKPTIFDELSAREKPSFAVVGKQKMRTFRNPSDRWSLEIDESGQKNVMLRAQKIIESDAPVSFLFIHLAAPDKMGHAYGESSRQYADALSQADALIGDLVETLRKEKELKRTTLIVTSDHGMLGNHHGGTTSEETTIPWIANGPLIKSNYDIQNPVNIFDTAPTILSLFDEQVPAELDGKALAEIIR